MSAAAFVENLTDVSDFGPYLSGMLEMEICRQRVRAKPFSQDFDEQMDAAVMDQALSYPCLFET